MQAGFHTTDITPALGMEQPGNYAKAFHTAFHDPLRVRAAVFDDGHTAVALVGIDTCILESWLASRIRDGVSVATGLPSGNIMLGASHTHSGGPLWGLDPRLLDGADPLVRRLATEFSVEGDPLYSDWVVRQAVSAVTEAYRRRERALLAIGSGREDGVAHNRRFLMDNGRACTHPGKGNPHIVAPAGPTDPEVGLIAAWTPAGRLLGTVVNYACHCTCGPGGISADWVAYLEQTVQRATAESAPVVFLQGASGDVTQVDNLSLRGPDFGEAETRKVGTRIGAEAVKLLAELEPQANATLATATRTLRVPRRVPDPAKTAEALACVQAGLDSGHRDTEWLFAKERLIAAHLQTVAPLVDVEVQGMRVGDAVLLANPAELFCELGLAIKAASPARTTLVVELANGCVGYVPGERAFGPDGGGYETVLTAYSTLVPAAGEAIVAAAVELAQELAPEPRESEAEPPRPPVRAWDYGVLGPDWD